MPDPGWIQALCAAVLDISMAVAVGLIALRPVVPAVALRRIGRRVVVVLGIGLIFYLLAGTWAMTGGITADTPRLVWLVLTQSYYGLMVWVAAAGWAWLAATELSVPVTTTHSSRWQFFYIIGLLMLAFSRAATGHAADISLFSMAVLIHSVHVLAAAVWAGSVCVSVMITGDWGKWNPARRTALGNRLSEVSTLALVFVAGTGVLNAVRTLGQAAAPWESDYTWILAAKLMCVAIAIVLGAHNRWHGLPMLPRPYGHGARGFRRVLIIEAVVLLLVLVMAAKLGTTMPPSTPS